jgi:hypothetical protein
MTEGENIRPRDRDAILQSLRAGVVPRVGLHLIQVGRSGEVKALLGDIDRIADGGSAIRFAIGAYGSGKTFFLNLVRSVALEKKLVTVHADLNPDRRLHSTSGQARSLFSELMRNTATRGKPDGAALPSVVERFVTNALNEAKTNGTTPESEIRAKLAQLAELVGGYDFAEVIAAYWRGHDTGDDTLKNNAIRWLRAEFGTKTEARTALGVRTIVDDANIYDQLKLMARLVRLAGFGGLMVCLDEMVNLYKLANTQARNSNYEQLLRILNDSLQGTAVGLGFLMSGTPEFLLDGRRGLYSYEALRSRLPENTYAVNGLVDLTGPVINLANLTKEDLYILLQKLRHVYAGGDQSRYLLPDEALKAFMEHCSRQIGEAYFRTPRNTITAFIGFLAVLEQNSQVPWSGLLGKVALSKDSSHETAPSDLPTGPGESTDDDLASFKL